MILVGEKHFQFRRQVGVLGDPILAVGSLAEFRRFEIRGDRFVQPLFASSGIGETRYHQSCLAHASGWYALMGNHHYLLERDARAGEIDRSCTRVRCEEVSGEW